MENACGDSVCRVRNVDSFAHEHLKLTPYEPHEIVERANECLKNPHQYDFLLNNCEHFATYCRYGKVFSMQALLRD